MVNIILANVGTVISFRTGNPADEQLLLPLFSPYIHEGEIANLSAFNFYMRLSAILAQEPLSGQTVLLDNNGSFATAQQVIEQSREAYGLKVIVENPAPKESLLVKHKLKNTGKKVVQTKAQTGRIQEAAPLT